MIDKLRDRLKSPTVTDSVLWALYFLSNHRMTDNDVLAIKMLSKYTNVVLLIGKADTYTKQELVDMQEEVFSFC